MSQRPILPILLLAAAASAAPAAITVTSNIKDGQTISGDVNFEITIVSKDLVTSVEFYINNDLRHTDDGTPYEFTLDAIKEPEGELKMKILVQTETGDQKTLELKLKVDNGVDKGADHWVEAGNQALAERKWDEAIKSGRIALKAKKAYDPARMVLAYAYFNKGVLDQAQKYAEDVLATDPENIQALDVTSAIALQQAFRARANTDRNTLAEAIQSALVRAAGNRTKANEAALNALGATTDANRIRVAEAAVRAHRYSVAIQALEPLYRSSFDNTTVVNLYLYAQLRAGRFSDATSTAVNYQKRGTPDGEGFALLAIVFEMNGEPTKADEFTKQSFVIDPGSPAVKLASLHRAWMNNQIPGYIRQAESLFQDQATATQPRAMAEARGHRSRANYRAGDLEGGRQNWEDAVTAAPEAYDLYIQQAVQTLNQSLTTGLEKEAIEFQRKLARAYLEAGRAARPDSFEVWAGIALLELLQGRDQQAAEAARTAIKAGPEYAAGYYVASIALTREDRRLESAIATLRSSKAAAEANKLAEEVTRLDNLLKAAEEAQRTTKQEILTATERFKALDKVNLAGVGVPDPVTALNYYSRFGRLPQLILTPIPR